MSANGLTIAVLVSAGRNPVSGAPRGCPGDAIALAFAKTLSNEPAAVFHAGEENEPALDDYLALGAQQIFVVPMPANGDAASALASHLKGFDVILTGTQSEHGPASGLTPYAIANALGRPTVANAVSATAAPSPPGERVGVRGRAQSNLETLSMGGGLSPKDEAKPHELHITQFLPKGQRRQIAASLPLVATIHPSARVTTSYAFARIAKGRLQKLASAPPERAPNTVHWQLEPRQRRHEPLRATQHLSGHDRMVSFIETPARRGLVVSEGSSVDKAQILLNYLREHRLIEL